MNSLSQKKCCSLFNNFELMIGNIDHEHNHDVVREVVHMFCVEAAKNGHFNCFEYVNERGTSFITKMCGLSTNDGIRERNHLSECGNHPEFWNAAAKNGHLCFLKSAKMTGARFDETTWETAATEGHLNILHSATTMGIVFTDSVWQAAATQGHLKILKFAKTNNYHFSSNVWIAAAKSGHVNILNFGHAMETDFHVETWVRAAIEGHLNVIKFAHSKHIYLKSVVWEKAAEHGHLNLIRFAHKNKITLHSQVWINASKMGFLEILEFGLQNKYECTLIWGVAAAHGHAHIIRFAIQKEITLKNDVWMAAVRNDEPEIIELAGINKIKIPDDVWIHAKSSFMFEILIIGCRYFQIHIEDDFWIDAANQNSVGKIEFFEFVFENFNFPEDMWYQMALNHMMSNDILCLAIEKDIELPEDILIDFFDVGVHVEEFGFHLLELALEKRIKMPIGILSLAASHCAVPFLESAIKLNMPFPMIVWFQLVEPEEWCNTERCRLFDIALERQIKLPENIWRHSLDKKAFDVLLVALKHDIILPENTLEIAACHLIDKKTNSQDDAKQLLKFAFEHGLTFTELTWMYLAESGCSLIVLAIEKKIQFNQAVLATIVANENVDTLKLAIENGYDLSGSDFWTFVLLFSGRRSTESLKFAIEQNFNFHDDVWVIVAEQGLFEIFKFAFDHGIKFNSETWYSAAFGKSDDFKCLMLGIDAKVEMDDRVWIRAILNDSHANVFRFAHEHGYVFGNSVWMAAAERNNLSVLGFAIKHGYILSKELLMTVVRQKGFDLINCLLRKRICFDDAVLFEVISMEGFHVFRRALKQKVSLPDNVWMAISKRKRFGFSGLRLNKMQQLS